MFFRYADIARKRAPTGGGTAFWRIGRAKGKYQFFVHDMAVHEGKAGKDRRHDTLLVCWYRS